MMGNSPVSFEDFAIGWSLGVAVVLHVIIIMVAAQRGSCRLIALGAVMAVVFGWGVATLIGRHEST